MNENQIEIPLIEPLVALSGRLICRDERQWALTQDLLPRHIELSRAEPGNLRFDLRADRPSLTWSLSELFADDAAFAAHQTRTKASRWGRDSGDLRREFDRVDVLPVIRDETPADLAQIAPLLIRAFNGPDEARLVEHLRRDGDLTLSLVAEAAGTLIGHLALSPVSAALPAVALAPVAVHPAMQSRGIGGALIRAALQRFPDTTIVVLGDPAYYARFGFTYADLASPYAGPHLMTLGPALPNGSRASHARAFQTPG